MFTHATSMHDFDHPKLEAMVELMLLAADADGEFSDDERKHVVASVESLTDGRLAGDTLDALMARVKESVAKEGRAARLAWVREQLPEANVRKAALTMAVRLMAADGVFRTAERDLVLEAADALGIDHDVMADLVAKLMR